MDDLSQSSVSDAVAAEAALIERAHYIAKAFQAYERHEYKLAILLLRNITLDDIPSIAILVNCAYDFWRSVQPESEHGSHVSGWNEKTPDQEEAQLTVKEAFTQLLGAGDKNMIPAFDYVRLSHVYISEAALQGALQICQLGQARGHLENLLLVVQSWAILKRVKGKQADVEHCMEYLTTAVQLEPRDNELGDPYMTDTDNEGELMTMTAAQQLDDHKRKMRSKTHTTIMEFNPSANPGMIMVQESDLPLGFVYLFCTSHLHRRSLRDGREAKAKAKDRELCYNMLAEAYHVLQHQQTQSLQELMDWFQSFELFFDMGLYLERSAFPLLAEEAYYEAFLRAPLLNISLEYLVSLMAKHKRGAKRLVIDIMRSAYDHNPWNLYMRNWLVEYEVEEKTRNSGFDTKYTARFEKDRAEAVKIQAAMRGYILRVFHWPEIYWKAKKKKDQWDEQVRQAMIAGMQCRRMLHLDRLMRWKKYSDDLHELRRHSSTQIQKVWRKHWGGVFYRRKLARAIRANGSFFLASQHHYNVTRSVTMRRWEGFYRATRLIKSARCLREVILANGYSVVFKEACDRILSVIRVTRKYSNRKMFYEWHKRWIVRRKRHARCTIRFFVRDTFIRYEEKKRADALERRQKAVAMLQARSTAYIMPLKGLMWGMWREVLYEKRAARARLRIRMWIPRLIARVKARKVVMLKRAKKEIHEAFIQMCLFNRVGKYLVAWQQSAASRPIQRMFRCHKARKVVKRLRFIREGIRQMRLAREARQKTVDMWRWKKFLYLGKRNYHRMASRITICFQHYLRTRHVYRASKRKPFMYKHLWVWHKVVLRRAFRKMAAGVVGLHTMLVLGPMFLSRWRQCVRLGFWRWKRQVLQQNRIHGMYNLLIEKRIESVFWRGAGDACVVERHFTYGKDELGSAGMARTAFLMSWESVNPEVLPPCDKSKLVLLNSELLMKIKAFKIIMASRRYRHRIVRNVQGSGVVAANLVYKGQLAIFLRQRSSLRLQRRWRIYRARIVVRQLRILAQRKSEVLEMMKGKPRYRTFQEMLRVQSVRSAARLALQCFWRQRLARNKIASKQVYKVETKKRVRVLNMKSSSARAILRRHFDKMQLAYVHSLSGLDSQGMATSIDNIKTRQDRTAYNEQQEAQMRDKRDRQNRGRKKILERNRSMGRLSPGAVIGHGRYTGIRKSSSAKALLQRGGGGSSLASASDEDEDGELDFDSQRRRSLVHGQEDDSTVSGSSIHSGHYSTIVTAGLAAVYEEEEEMGDNESHMMRMYGDDGYQHLSISAKMQALTTTASPDFNSHMYRLQQTGIFIFDPYTMAAAVGDRSGQGLRPLELAFIMQSAQTVFIQNTNSLALKNVFKHFIGSKVVLCGGSLSCIDALFLLSYVGDRRETVSLHISDTYIAFSALLAMIQCLGEPSTNAGAMIAILCRGIKVVPPSLNCLNALTELSIDTASIGPMGMALLIACLRTNSTISTVILKINNPADILPCYANALGLLTINDYIKELRIFGAPLAAREVKALYEAVYGGLRGLSLLEFGAVQDPPTMELSSRIIELAKDRLYAGRGSLSVSVI
jgi:hypothetical protein